MVCKATEFYSFSRKQKQLIAAVVGEMGVLTQFARSDPALVDPDLPSTHLQFVPSDPALIDPDPHPLTHPPPAST